MEKTTKSAAQSRAVTAFLLAPAAAFILAGCFNSLDPRNPLESASRSGAGSLSVSIARQDGGERTLYPNAAFTKYVLAFASSEAGKAYGPKTLTGKNSEVFTDVPAGEWTVTAAGYVAINGTEYAAAEGSKEVTVIAGVGQSVSIAISAEQEGDNGYFAYNVTFPDAKVDAATLTVLRYNAAGGVTAVADPVNLKASSSGYFNGEAGLAPGYYRVDIVLENANQSTGVNEVVHIYSNMETSAVYAYTEADFIDFITLSGTVTIDGGDPQRVSVSAYEEGTYSIGSASIDPYTAGAPWSMTLPPFSAETTVTFSVSYYDSSGNYSGVVSGISPTTVSTASIPNISLDLVILSGTITATVNGEDPSHVYIYAHEGESTYILGSASLNPYSKDASWSMTLPAFSEETTVTFSVSLYDPSGKYAGAVSGISPAKVSNTGVSNISLKAAYATVTLSGTITATVNDEDPAHVYIYAHAEGTSYSIGSASLNPYSKGASWSMTLPAFSEETTVTFSVSLYDPSGKYAGSVSGISPTTVSTASIPNISLKAAYTK
ncbi:MAG: hypothetical protein LBE17_07395 [Treponema sp.]|jgi:hypothetical protein|nr:hypothetical protein [Treponema sp.]